MKKRAINKIKKCLLTEKEYLIIKQAEIVDIDSSGDEVDNIQAKILANTQAQISAREKTRLKNIEIALNKIEEGNFGNCEECSEEIAEKRLLFNPSFSKCISCAEKEEAEEKGKRF